MVNRFIDWLFGLMGMVSHCPCGGEIKDYSTKFALCQKCDKKYY